MPLPDLIAALRSAAAAGDREAAAMLKMLESPRRIPMPAPGHC